MVYTEAAQNHMSLFKGISVPKIFTLPFLLLALQVFTAPTASASLIGDTVVLTRLFDNAIIGDGSCCGPFNVVVQAGSGDLTSLSLGNNLFVNPEASSILVQFGPNGGSGCQCPTDSRLVFDSLDWVGSPGTIITGVTFDTDLSGFSSAFITFGPHRVDVQYQSISYSGGQYLNLFLQTNEVPEPSALLLSLSGIAGLFGLRRYLARAKPLRAPAP